MFKDFLYHRCNIYHLVDEQVNVGYGINTGTVKGKGNEPDLTDVLCHFHNRSNSLKIVQHEPYSSEDGEVKLSLPIGTDIRQNDMVERCDTGERFRASIPKVVHGQHHIIVQLMREKGVRSAI